MWENITLWSFFMTPSILFEFWHNSRGHRTDGSKAFTALQQYGPNAFIASLLSRACMVLIERYTHSHILALTFQPLSCLETAKTDVEHRSCILQSSKWEILTEIRNPVEIRNPTEIQEKSEILEKSQILEQRIEIRNCEPIFNSREQPWLHFSATRVENNRRPNINLYAILEYGAEQL